MKLVEGLRPLGESDDLVVNFFLHLVDGDADNPVLLDGQAGHALDSVRYLLQAHPGLCQNLGEASHDHLSAPEPLRLLLPPLALVHGRPIGDLEADGKLIRLGGPEIFLDVDQRLDEVLRRFRQIV